MGQKEVRLKSSGFQKTSEIFVTIIGITRRHLRPHQGAKNSTSDGLPDFRTTASKLLGMRSITAETAFEPKIAKEATKTLRSKPILKYEN